jgi:tetratricopeptide (TPR) repeat protein
VIERRPDFAEGWNKRATVLFLMGEHEASLRDCDEVLKRNPKHFGALSGAGQNEAHLGRLERAIDFFQRALAVNPNLPGPAASIRVLEQHLRARERDKA